MFISVSSEAAPSIYIISSRDGKQWLEYIDIIHQSNSLLAYHVKAAAPAKYTRADLEISIVNVVERGN